MRVCPGLTCIERRFPKKTDRKRGPTMLFVYGLMSFSCHHFAFTPEKYPIQQLNEKWVGGARWLVGIPFKRCTSPYHYCETDTLHKVAYKILAAFIVKEEISSDHILVTCEVKTKQSLMYQFLKDSHTDQLPMPGQTTRFSVDRWLLFT